MWLVDLWTQEILKRSGKMLVFSTNDVILTGEPYGGEKESPTLYRTHPQISIPRRQVNLSVEVKQ